MSLNANGNILAVGAASEDSSSATNSGAVYVFTLNNTTWSEPIYIDASNAGADDSFGVSVSLSADGNTLAVGANNEKSNSTQIHNIGDAAAVGEGKNNDTFAAGAVYAFAYSGTGWIEQAYIKGSNTDAGDQFGLSVSISADGNTLAVVAIGEDSIATGINNNALQGDDTATDSGAAYVFIRTGAANSAVWTQQAYLKASNTGASYEFGYSVSISPDGNTLTLGSADESSPSTGINGDQERLSGTSGTTPPGTASGAVYTFTRSGTTWTQQAYIKASNADGTDAFGSSVALSSNGLAVGARKENSNATGVNGDQDDNSATEAGAVYLY